MTSNDPGDFDLMSMTTNTLTLGNYTTTMNTSLTNSLWNQTTYTINSSPYTGSYIPSITVNGNTKPSLNVTGKSSFHDDIKLEDDADILIRGKKLSSILDKISERLAICHLNPELEKRWEQLKVLGDEYRKLEQELIEAEKTFEIMKT